MFSINLFLCYSILCLSLNLQLSVLYSCCVMCQLRNYGKKHSRVSSWSSLPSPTSLKGEPCSQSSGVSQEQDNWRLKAAIRPMRRSSMSRQGCETKLPSQQVCQRKVSLERGGLYYIAYNKIILYTMIYYVQLYIYHRITFNKYNIMYNLFILYLYVI